MLEKEQCGRLLKNQNGGLWKGRELERRGKHSSPRVMEEGGLPRQQETRACAVLLAGQWEDQEVGSSKAQKDREDNQG